MEVKLAVHPDGAGTEQYVLCRSADRCKKESSMLEQQRLRVVARPDKLVAELLAHFDLQLPKVPKIVQNVVPQIAR